MWLKVTAPSFTGKLALQLYFNTAEVQNAKTMKKGPGKNAATDNTIYIS